MGEGPFIAADSNDSASGENLPPRAMSRRPVGAEGSGMVWVCGWYCRVPLPSTNGLVVPCGSAHIGSSSLHLALQSSVKSESIYMIKDLVLRTWRIAVTVGPLVAIALTLAAGIKWR